MRKFSLFLLLCGLVLCLAACGPKETCLLYTSPSPRDCS